MASFYILLCRMFEQTIKYVTSGLDAESSTLNQYMLNTYDISTRKSLPYK